MKADLVVKNGWVVTPEQTFKVGVAIANGKFVAIGTDDSLPDATETIDVKGKQRYRRCSGRPPWRSGSKRGDMGRDLESGGA